jgi:hypothetical protein
MIGLAVSPGDSPNSLKGAPCTPLSDAGPSPIVLPPSVAVEQSLAKTAGLPTRLAGRKRVANAEPPEVAKARLLAQLAERRRAMSVETVPMPITPSAESRLDPAPVPVRRGLFRRLVGQAVAAIVMVGGPP